MLYPRKIYRKYRAIFDPTLALLGGTHFSLQLDIQRAY